MSTADACAGRRGGLKAIGVSTRYVVEAAGVEIEGTRDLSCPLDPSCAAEPRLSQETAVRDPEPGAVERSGTPSPCTTVKSDKSDEGGGGDPLEVVRESGGLRHYLSSKAVHPGAVLELGVQGDAVSWLVGRYEYLMCSSGTIKARLIVDLTTPNGKASVEIILPESACLRWPSRADGAR